MPIFLFLLILLSASNSFAATVIGSSKFTTYSTNRHVEINSKVPYAGASGDVNLGVHNLSVSGVTGASIALGTTLSSWLSTVNPVEGPNGNGLLLYSGGGQYFANAIRSPSGWKRAITGYATDYLISNNGSHTWYTASSDVAGSAISWVNAMALGGGSLTVNDGTVAHIIACNTGGTANCSGYYNGGATTGLFDFTNNVNVLAIDTATHNATFIASVSAPSFSSTAATGTAPLTVTSTTEVTNLHAATATALASAPTGCTTGQYVTAVAANGALTCSVPSTGLTSVTADAPLSGSGTAGSHLAIATATDSVAGAMSAADHAVLTYLSGLLPHFPGNDSYTKLLLHMDGVNGSTTFTDSSASAHAMTATAARISTEHVNFGQSGYFNGGSYLTTPNSTDFQFGSGDFTVEAWIYQTALPYYSCIVSRGDNATIAGSEYNFRIDNNAKATMQIFSGSGYAAAATSTGSISLNTWYHLAGVRHGNTITMYVNGIADGTANVTGVTLNSVNVTTGIGAVSSTGGQPFSGYMDELRISKGIARWTGNFTPGGPYY